jgi:creatinine amidohydrolase/Fe(II)-dependent formamide hydrolase-like protein
MMRNRPPFSSERRAAVGDVLHAEDINYTQVRAFDRDHTIAFLPISALEVHGPHLPLGSDLFTARWMAEDTAKAFAAVHPDWTVVRFLPLTLGTDEVPLPGSMNGTQREVYRVLLSQGASLAQAGYRYVVVTNGHGGARHASGVEAACREVSRRHGIEMFTPAAVVLYDLINGPRFDRLETVLGRPLTAQERAGLLTGEHAATMETSLILAERPDLVDPIYRQLGPGGPPPFRPLAALSLPLAGLLGRGDPERQAKVQEMVGALAGGIGWFLNARYGYGGPEVTYMGDPSAASAELGHAIRQAAVEDCLALVESVVRGERRAADVRSIASDSVLIHPLFLRRLALVAGAVAAVFLLTRRRCRRCC